MTASDDDTPPMPEDNPNQDRIQSETEDTEMDEFYESTYRIDEEDGTGTESERQESCEEEEDGPDLWEFTRKLKSAERDIRQLEESDSESDDTDNLGRKHATIPGMPH
jgi:hypothetical protein